MIYTKGGSQFRALLENAKTGLVGTVGVKLLAPDNTVAIPRSTAGIVEEAPGNYIYTGTAPQTEGEYLLVWDKGAGVENTAAEQVQVTRVLPFEAVVAFLPEPADVAVFLRARTYVEGGEQEGEFTTATRPTHAQVVALINQSANEVSARLGQTIEDDTLRAFARNVVAIRAAMMIELSYFPEQADEGAQTVYSGLKVLYDANLRDLMANVQIRSLFGESVSG